MSPPLLECTQGGGASVREAELRAQALLKRTLALTCLGPLRVGDLTYVTLQGGRRSREAVRFKEGDPLPVAQEISLPVLAAAHAAIARLHGTDEPLQIIVRPRQSGRGGPDKQVRVHPREHADEVRQAVGIGW